VTLILGGARSGKSALAERLIQALPPPWTYVATAEALDEEMRLRIAEHRRRRAEGWVTIEAPLALPEALGEAPGPVLVDCLTLWLTNLILAERDVDAATAALEAALGACRAPAFLVANEVGLGIVPDHALGRVFRDAAGRLNQRLAARAERVLFMVAGLPITVKGTP
jgi:adenosylcobinamide kinase/adenosylcobinamide-phosphate guanylyltransferase